jgi:WXG100 family type VII secretion target
MAGTRFDVTHENLTASAGKVEVKAQEFKKSYESIYTAVTDLRVTYKGQASDTFNQRIEGYKNDFNAVDKALAEYVQFLTEYASKMKSTEEDLKGKAASLSVGQ